MSTREISKTTSKKPTSTVEIPIRLIIDDIVVSAQDMINEEIKNQRNGEEVDKIYIQYLIDLCFDVNEKVSTRAELLKYWDNLSETWTNLCEDSYFKKHPNVLNVLMVVDEDTKEKFWVAAAII